MSATKRPWHLRRTLPLSVPNPLQSIVGDDGQIIGEICSPHAEANAALIVVAVNEFDRIGGVEGLKDLERQAAKYLDQRHTFNEAKAALEELLSNPSKDERDAIEGEAYGMIVLLTPFQWAEKKANAVLAKMNWRV